MNEGVGYLGRPEDLQKLTNALSGVIDEGVGHLLLVTGVHGSGKTSLVKTLREAAAERGADFHYGACTGGEELQPMGAVEEILRGLCRDRRTAEQARALLLARGLNLSLSEGAAPPPAPAPEDLFDSVTLDARRRRRYALFDGVTKLFQGACARRPLVVVLDDLQRADELLLEFLTQMVYDLAGLKLLLVCVFGEGGSAADEADRLLNLARQTAAGVSQLELAPLDADGLDALLKQLYPSHRFTRDFLTILFTECGGNPMVLKELGTSLELLGIVYQGGTDWYNHAWAELAPGEGLEGTVYRRLGKLNEAELDLLEFLAGLPTRFPLALLSTDEVRGYLGVSERILLKRLSRFAQPFGIFELSGPWCHLRHPFLRDAIVQDLPERIVARDAEVLAEGLARLTPAGVAPAAGVIGAAFLRAGSDGKALEHLLLAARYLEGATAWTWAVRVLLQCLEVMQRRVQDDEAMARTVEVHLRLAEDFQLQDLSADAVGHLERALPLLGAMGQGSRRAQVELRVAYNRIRMGLQEEAESILADRLGNEEAPVEERMVAGLLLARSYLERTRGEEALETLKEAARLSSQVGEGGRGYLARLLVATGELTLERDDAPRARALLEEGLGLALDESTVRVDALVALADLGVREGAVEAAAGRLLEAMALAERLGYLEGKARASEIQATLQEDKDADEALRLLLRAYGYFTKARNFPGLQRVCARLGAIYKVRDDPERAAFFLDRSYRILQKQGLKEALVQTGLVLGELALKANKLYEGERYFSEGQRLAGETKNRMGEGFALFGLGKVFMAQRKLDKGREHLERAKAVFAELNLAERVAMVDKELRLAKV